LILVFIPILGSQNLLSPGMSSHLKMLTIGVGLFFFGEKLAMPDL
jgi:hypothetical protein